MSNLSNRMWTVTSQGRKYIFTTDEYMEKFPYMAAKGAVLHETVPMVMNEKILDVPENKVDEYVRSGARLYNVSDRKPLSGERKRQYDNFQEQKIEHINQGGTADSFMIQQRQNENAIESWRQSGADKASMHSGTYRNTIGSFGIGGLNYASSRGAMFSGGMKRENRNGELSRYEQMKAFSKGYNEYIAEYGNFWESVLSGTMQSIPRMAESMAVGGVAGGVAGAAAGKIAGATSVANIAGGAEGVARATSVAKATKKAHDIAAHTARFASMGTASMGSKYLDLQREQHLEFHQIMTNAVLSGMATATAESFGTFANIDKWTRTIGRAAALNSWVDKLGMFARRLGLGMAEEGVEELLETWAEYFVDRFTIGEDKGVVATLQQSGVAFLQGALGAAILSPVFGAMNLGDYSDIKGKKLIGKTDVYMDTKLAEAHPMRAERIANAFMKGENLPVINDIDRQLIDSVFVRDIDREHVFKNEANRRQNSERLLEVVRAEQRRLSHSFYSDNPRVALLLANQALDYYGKYVTPEARSEAENIRNQIREQVREDVRSKTRNRASAAGEVLINAANQLDAEIVDILSISFPVNFGIDNNGSLGIEHYQKIADIQAEFERDYMAVYGESATQMEGALNLPAMKHYLDIIGQVSSIMTPALKNEFENSLSQKTSALDNNVKLYDGLYRDLAIQKAELNHIDIAIEDLTNTKNRPSLSKDKSDIDNQIKQLEQRYDTLENLIDKNEADIVALYQELFKNEADIQNFIAANEDFAIDIPERRSLNARLWEIQARHDTIKDKSKNKEIETVGEGKKNTKVEPKKTENTQRTDIKKTPTEPKAEVKTEIVAEGKSEVSDTEAGRTSASPTEDIPTTPIAKGGNNSAEISAKEFEVGNLIKYRNELQKELENLKTMPVGKIESESEIRNLNELNKEIKDLKDGKVVAKPEAVSEQKAEPKKAVKKKGDITPKPEPQHEVNVTPQRKHNHLPKKKSPRVIDKEIVKKRKIINDKIQNFRDIDKKNVSMKDLDNVLEFISDINQYGYLDKEGFKKENIIEIKREAPKIKAEILEALSEKWDGKIGIKLADVQNRYGKIDFNVLEKKGITFTADEVRSIADLIDSGEYCVIYTNLIQTSDKYYKTNLTDDIEIVKHVIRTQEQIKNEQEKRNSKGEIQTKFFLKSDEGLIEIGSKTMILSKQTEQLEKMKFDSLENFTISEEYNRWTQTEVYARYNSEKATDEISRKRLLKEANTAHFLLKDTLEKYMLLEKNSKDVKEIRLSYVKELMEQEDTGNMKVKNENELDLMNKKAWAAERGHLEHVDEYWKTVVKESEELKAISEKYNLNIKLLRDEILLSFQRGALVEDNRIVKLIPIEDRQMLKFPVRADLYDYFTNNNKTLVELDEIIYGDRELKIFTPTDNVNNTLLTKVEYYLEHFIEKGVPEANRLQQTLDNFGNFISSINTTVPIFNKNNLKILSDKVIEISQNLKESINNRTTRKNELNKQFSRIRTDWRGKINELATVSQNFDEMILKQQAKKDNQGKKNETTPEHIRAYIKEIESQIEKVEKENERNIERKKNVEATWKKRGERNSELYTQAIDELQTKIDVAERLLTQFKENLKREQDRLVILNKELADMEGKEGEINEEKGRKAGVLEQHGKTRGDGSENFGDTRGEKGSIAGGVHEWSKKGEVNAEKGRKAGVLEQHGKTRGHREGNNEQSEMARGMGGISSTMSFKTAREYISYTKKELGKLYNLLTDKSKIQSKINLFKNRFYDKDTGKLKKGLTLAEVQSFKYMHVEQETIDKHLKKLSKEYNTTFNYDKKGYKIPEFQDTQKMLNGMGIEVVPIHADFNPDGEITYGSAFKKFNNVIYVNVIVFDKSFLTDRSLYRMLEGKSKSDIESVTNSYLDQFLQTSVHEPFHVIHDRYKNDFDAFYQGLEKIDKFVRFRDEQTPVLENDLKYEKENISGEIVARYLAKEIYNNLSFIHVLNKEIEPSAFQSSDEAFQKIAEFMFKGFADYQANPDVIYEAIEAGDINLEVGRAEELTSAQKERQLIREVKLVTDTLVNKLYLDKEMVEKNFDRFTKHIGQNLTSKGMELTEQNIVELFDSLMYSSYLKEHKLFKWMTETEPKYTESQLKKMSIIYGTDEIYTEAFLKNEMTGSQEKQVSNYMGFGNWLEDIFTPIASRVKRIAPELHDILTKYESKLGVALTKRNAAVKPYAVKFNKLPKHVQVTLDLALKNADREMIRKIHNEYDMAAEYQTLRGMLDGIHQEALEAGFTGLGYLRNYVPRVFKANTFLHYISELEKSNNFKEGALRHEVEKFEAMKDRPINDVEFYRIVNRMIVHGDGDELVGVNAIGNYQKRKSLMIDDTTNKAFFMPAIDGILHYVNSATNRNHTRALLGYDISSEQKIDMSKPLQGTLPGKMAELIKDKKISEKDQAILTRLFHTRLAYKPTPHGVQKIKNITNLGLIANTMTAITQLEEISLAFLHNPKVATGELFNTLRGKGYMKLSDMGIDSIGAEFNSEGINKWMDRAFNWSLVKAFDSIGKVTYINTVLSDYHNKALNNKFSAKEKAELIRMFGGETEALINDLKNKTKSENVVSLLFNKISGVQPVSLSEVPYWYLKSPGSRLAYQYKTFLLKRFDMMRTEIYDGFKTAKTEGELLKYCGRMMKLLGVLCIFGVGNEALKDWWFGRGVDLTEEINDVALKYVLHNRYQKAMIDQNRPVRYLLSYVPATSMPLTFYRDAKNVGGKVFKGEEVDWVKLRSIEHIPIVGKEVYWRLRNDGLW